jgi:hypothetical protein
MNNFLNRNYNRSVSKAHIIYLPNNNISTTLANRCKISCETVGQPYMLWEGFDGTRNNISVPESIKNQTWYKWLKVTDHYQSIAEIATSLSHISLWVKCMEEDTPLVVLEHDAIMIKKVEKHPYVNTVMYLGCKDQLKNNYDPSTTPYSCINLNWYFINRAHAYSIDPISAKKLFTMVLDRGIFESLDVMIKVDEVAVIQNDFYAYDEPGETTISTRKK